MKTTLPSYEPSAALQECDGQLNHQAENHRMVWIGRDLKDPLVPIPYTGRDTFHYSKWLRVPFQACPEHFRDGAVTDSLGSVFQIFSHYFFPQQLFLSKKQAITGFSLTLPTQRSIPEARGKGILCWKILSGLGEKLVTLCLS